MSIQTNPSNCPIGGIIYVIILLSFSGQFIIGQSIAGLRFSAEEFSGSLEDNTTILSGNVTVTADDIELAAEEVTVKRNENSYPVSIVASGDPVKITMTIEKSPDDQQTLEATAKELSYNRLEGWIKFTGDSTLAMDNTEIIADVIHIDIESKNISATMDDPDAQVEINMYDVEER